MRYLLAVVIFSLTCAGVAYGQGASDMKLERLGVINAGSVPRTNAFAHRVRTLPVLPEDPELFQSEKLKAQQGIGGALAPALSEPANTLTFNATFPGLTLADTPGYVPPDTQVAAGSNSGTLNEVEMVNGTIRIFNASGTTINTIDMCSFFCDFFTDLISDPIVRYDPDSGRWFASVIALEFVVQGPLLTLEGQWRLAVSNTSDPNGAWTVYAATMTNGTFPDFPKMAVSSDKVVQTGDAFTISSNRFKGTEFIVVKKADLVAGVQSPSFEYFAPAQGLFALAAAELLPSSSISSTVYLAAVGSSKSGSFIRVWQLNGVPNAPNGTGVTVTTTNYSTAPFKTPPNAPQPGTSTLIDTNGDWLVDAFYQNGNLWVAANSGCVPSGDTTTRSCMRFVEIKVGGAVLQDLTFGEPGEYYYYPAFRADPTGNLIAVFSRSSASEFVGVYASGQTVSNPNTFQVPAVVKSGEAAYTISPPRWGDYFGASNDPITTTMVWIAGEYAQSGNQWATYLAQAHF